MDDVAETGVANQLVYEKKQEDSRGRQEAKQESQYSPVP